MTRRLPTRQVHLDFHTSKHIGDVCKNFNKEDFQRQLKLGEVESMTIFAKCHHGYCYYPSSVGVQHPSMQSGRDFTGEVIDACHEIGVFAPIYITVGWSVYDAETHEDWVVRKKDGTANLHNMSANGKIDDPLPECSWVNLCTAGGYRNYLYELTKEVCERYKRVDGIFFDICFTMYDQCYCESCKKGMKDVGLDSENENDAKAYYEMQKKITYDNLSELIFQYHPEASLFYNTGGAEIHMPQWSYLSTHYELEDLPTTWGGYDKMPMRAKYFSAFGKDYLGMTGKFHRSWGEFGGYKTPDALRYECASLMAYGARISIGDQMHPCGTLEDATYENMGQAFGYVKEIEDYCFDVTETATVGVMVSKDSTVNDGMAKLLLDSHIDFDVVHNETEFSKFDTVILPDNYALNETEAKYLQEYITSGKNVIMLGGSGLKEGTKNFAFDIALQYIEKSPYDMDYFSVEDEISEGMVKTPILCYTSAHIVEPTSSTTSLLAKIYNPYFSRTYGKFCSHYNTPYKQDASGYSAVLKNGSVLYVAHELAKIYYEYGATYHRQYFTNILKTVHKKNIVTVAMPSAGRMRFVNQKGKSRYVLHLLYASPISRGNVSVIEDLPTIIDTKVTLDISEQTTIRRIYLAPQNTDIEYTRKGSCVMFKVDEFSCHQIIVVDYDECK